VQNPGENAQLSPPTPNPLDAVAAALQEMRAAAGNLSFQTIATRITQAHLAVGTPQYAASVSRHTVYDCFRLGRTRMNPELVRDIALALTDDAAAADQWQAHCRAAQRSQTKTIQIEAGQVTPAQNVATQITAPANAGPVAASSYIAKIRFRAILLLVGVLLNLVPYIMTQVLFDGYVPLFFDMFGTALVSIVLGPWWGVLAAVLSSVAATQIGVVGTTLHFAPVAIVGALVWGYGVHRWRLASNLPRFIALNTVVGIACTMTAFIVIQAFFSGQAMQSVIQQMSNAAIGLRIPPALAVLGTNLLVSVIDKTLAGLFALLAAGGILANRAPADVVALTDPLHNAMQFAARAVTFPTARVISATT
jgi:energy-coupling factor transport system substrate-specific component